MDNPVGVIRNLVGMKNEKLLKSYCENEDQKYDSCEKRWKITAVKGLCCNYFGKKREATDSNSKRWCENGNSRPHKLVFDKRDSSPLTSLLMVRGKNSDTFDENYRSKSNQISSLSSHLRW